MSSNKRWKPLVSKAQTHFNQYILPRFIEDNDGIRRKVLNGEENRGELFNLSNISISDFFLFGFGIGVYFLQLLILSGILFLCGLIMVYATYQYTTNSYGVTSSNELVTISAACSAPKALNVSIGCSTGQISCTAYYRENCELPYGACLCDLMMSLIFILLIYASYYLESSWETHMDKSVTTSRDYSIVIADPGEREDDPDVWKDFFSKIKHPDGRARKVRYITIARRNLALCKLIAEKHKITRKLNELSKIVHLNSVGRTWESFWLSKYDHVNKELANAYMDFYPVCKVFVTFDLKSTQREYLNAMEVPDFAALMDYKSNISKEFYFKSSHDDNAVNILNILPAAEPDDIRWENIEEDPTRRAASVVLGYVVVGGTMVATYFAINYATSVSSTALAIVIAGLDTLLGSLFEIITELGSPSTEGEKQSSLQLKLFFVRLLISTVFPYLQTDWTAFLDAEIMQKIITVQLSACILSPLITLTDIGGVINRNIVAPYLSQTQAELNSQWSGSAWSLAERYTVLSKILFISMFYAILTPVALFIGCISFLLVFLVDRFLLLRNWAPIGLLDSSVARRLRQQAIFCVAAHMYITLRLIYSWPMDSSYQSSPGVFKKVNKFPSPAVFTYRVQDWHTSSQKTLLPVYLIAYYVVMAGLIVTWVVLPLASATYRFFFKMKYSTSDDNNPTSFEKSMSVKAYVPLLKIGSEKFLCSYVERIQPTHRPMLVRSIPEDKDDLSSYVPIEHQQRVLSIVKYYDDGDYEAQKSTGRKESRKKAIPVPVALTPPGSPHKKLNLADINLLPEEKQNFLRLSPRDKGGSYSIENKLSIEVSRKLNSPLPPSKVNTVVPERSSAHHNRKVQKRLIMNIPTMPLADTNNHTDDLDNSANTSNKNNNNNNNNFSLPNSYRINLQPLNRVQPLGD